MGHGAEEHVARGRDGGRRVARRADAAQLLPVGDNGRDARGNEHAREAPGSENWRAGLAKANGGEQWPYHNGTLAGLSSFGLPQFFCSASPSSSGMPVSRPTITL